MKRFAAVLVCALFASLLPEVAQAHSVQTDYLLGPDSGLSLDVTYSTGDPVSTAPVKIYSPDNPNEPWLEGTTDENGKFSFAPDSEKQGEWTVEIGEFDHADILSVPVNENGVELDAISQGFPTQNTPNTTIAQALTLNAQPAQASASGVSATETSTSPLDLSLEGLLLLGLGGGLGLSLWRKLR